MTRLPGLSRRTLLRSAAAASAVTGLTVAVAPASSAARSRVDRRAIQRLAASRRRALARIRAGHRSANGWEVETVVDDGGAIWTRPVAGSEASVAVRIGAAETVLLHVVRRWNYEVSTLRAGDVVGFRPVGRGRGPESDHGSGTAVDILPGSLPAGTRDGLLPAQVAVVRDILEDCEGVVRWGGDARTPHQAHFALAVPPGNRELARVAAKIRTWNETPGVGAGVLFAAH
jgi:hypothetical protein